VRADGAELERALLNLVANARDAMPEGGTLTIETKQEDDVVHIRVVDTGIGISPAARDRVFEPTFTSRATRASVRRSRSRFQRPRSPLRARGDRAHTSVLVVIESCGLLVSAGCDLFSGRIEWSRGSGGTRRGIDLASTLARVRSSVMFE